MPNWATNTLAFSGPKESVDRVRESLVPEEGDTAARDYMLDFNHLVPMPEALNGVASPTKVVTTREEADEINKSFPWRDRKAITRSEAELLTALYGATNWYDWSLRNWGTKWNGSGVVVLRDTPGLLVLRFDTAWTEPGEYLEKISRKHGLTIFGGVIYEDGSEFAALGYGLGDEWEVRAFETLFEVREETELIDGYGPVTHRWIEMNGDGEHAISEEPGGFEKMPDNTR